MARLSNPFIQYVDGNGDVEAGSKLNFYETGGTTTRKATFKDSGLTNANTNPVIANADGFFGDIWLDGLYNVVLTDSADVSIDDADPVGGAIQGQWELWLNDTTYNIPNIVLASDDNYYRSLTNDNQGNDPTSSASSWEQIELGRIWNINVTYGIGDSAYGFDGNLYKSETANNLGNNPVSDAVNWSPGVKIDAISLPTGYHSGGQTTWVSVTDITIAAGSFRDSTDSVDIVIGEQTKEIDNTYVAGNGGGLPSSLTVANDTSYHIFAAAFSDKADGYIFDTSTVCANGIADENVTHFRYIRASVMTDGSSNIEGYKQNDTRFDPDARVINFNNGSPGTSQVTVTAAVPTGFPLIAGIAGDLEETNNAGPFIIMQSLTQDDVVANDNSNTMSANEWSTIGSCNIEIMTNTSGQYGLRSTFGSGINILTNTTTHWYTIWGDD